VDNVKVFTYLGTKIHYKYTSIGDEEIQHRITAAKASFQQLKHLLRNFYIHLPIRMQFFNAFVAL